LAHQVLGVQVREVVAQGVPVLVGGVQLRAAVQQRLMPDGSDQPCHFPAALTVGQQQPLDVITAMKGRHSGQGLQAQTLT
jgi:hypothetical protein